MATTDLSEGSGPFSHATARLSILLFHFSQTILCRTEVAKRLIKVVVEVVFTRADLLQRPMNVVV